MPNGLKTALLLGILSALLLGLGEMLGGAGGLMTAFVFAAAMNMGSYWFSDKIVLRMYRAAEVGPTHQLYRIVERLTARANLPMPKVYVIPDASPNAFATGRNPAHAAVAATEGILRVLSESELEGVIAHELAHVQHRDVLIMTVASFFASIAALVLQFAPFLGGGRDREGGQPAFIVVLLVSVAVYLLSFVLMLALSRHRELVADRGAAVLTGRPSALSAALMKIDRAMRGTPDRDLRAAAEMNAFFIVPASVKGSLRTLLATHPPIEQRIAALGRIEAAMQSGPARGT
jgi:heat shock protein HtpX